MWDPTFIFSLVAFLWSLKSQSFLDYIWATTSCNNLTLRYDRCSKDIQPLSLVSTMYCALMKLYILCGTEDAVCKRMLAYSSPSMAATAPAAIKKYNIKQIHSRGFTHLFFGFPSNCRKFGRDYQGSYHMVIYWSHHRAWVLCCTSGDQCGLAQKNTSIFATAA